MIVQLDQPRRLETIVAAIDPDEDDSKKTVLSRQIVEIAASLAEHNDARLQVVHSWSAHGETLLNSRWTEEKLEQYVAEWKEAAQYRVDRFVSQLDNVVSEVHVLKGDVTDVLTRFVTVHGVDLVVMGSVCRTGVAGYLIGNTAENVLRHLSCSVLAIKPDDFHSPIAPTANKDLDTYAENLDSAEDVSE